ncbi:MAG: tRNA 2-thiocytidine biosynthesis TtcA family protein [Treponema sp.]|jgi:tRNA 2-thiocytidine biosynthesis protein TtcA|nr:tRNA 2-thiocytidine biosynthesis TtcA family protein [Treponema sp.]
MAERFLRRAAPCRIVRKLCAKAVLEHGLIEKGDRILVACSGGKDSTVLAWALATLKQELRLPYELAALHISTDFCACCKKGVLAARLAEWGIPFNDIDVPVIGRLKPGRRMNCYWCSTQRRTELLRYAIAGGFNKIALGHHLDDIIETFFMNLLGKGELRAMPLLLRYQKYPVTLIRPLGGIEERQIISCADELDILKAACTCPFGLRSKRRVIRERIASLTGGSGAEKRRILRALGSGERNLLEE